MIAATLRLRVERTAFACAACHADRAESCRHEDTQRRRICCRCWVAAPERRMTA